MRVAVEAITSEDALAWFAHGGYGSRRILSDTDQV
jgi:hypothetical protein